MRVAILTLGCRVNQAESSVLEGALKENGATIVNLNENPDYCVVNTCTVTIKSDYQSRQLIRRGVRTGARVFVTGCYAHLRPSDISAIRGVFEIFDNKSKMDIVSKITEKPFNHSTGGNNYSRPYVKVQDGCNFSCSYCAVPLARGKSRSVPAEDVVRIVHTLVHEGYKEIVLTGIHLGTYGQDFSQPSNLAHLVRTILERTGIYRIRLSSLESQEINDELLELLQDSRLCDHLHLPLQSGSNKILSLMNRKYSVRQYMAKIDAILNRIPDIAIGTDVITGFPGEGHEEFLETRTMLDTGGFSYFHVFPFSPRPGTLAASMMNSVCDHEVKRRVKLLLELNKVVKKRYATNNDGRTLEAVMEEKLGNDRVILTSSNYLKIRALVACHDEYVRGSVVSVSTAGYTDGVLEGILIK